MSALIGEIRIFAGPVPPPGWAICDGAALLIDGHEDLYALIGKSFGDGVEFRLPDLRSRTWQHLDPQFFANFVGILGGAETVTLEVQHLPSHSHAVGCAAVTQNISAPSANVLADTSGGATLYHTSPGTTSLASGTVGQEGGGQSHDNIPPYLAVTFIICIAGGLVPVAGSSSGGAFSSFGGMLQLVAFSNLVMAGYMRVDGAAFFRTVFTGLFSLIGTTFGIGDGSTTANLPNLLNKTVNGAGTGSYSLPSTYAVGDQTGEAAHLLTTGEMPAHSHPFRAVSEAGDVALPTAVFLGASPNFHATVAGAMDATMVGNTGGGSTHDNWPPYSGLTVLQAVDDVTPDLYTGEIVIGPWTSAPTGTLLCDASAVTIAAQPALFDVIGYTYGHGAGTDFLLPDGRGRIFIGAGRGNGLSPYSLGQAGGAEAVPLTTDQIPGHSHPILATRVLGNLATGSGHLLGRMAGAYRVTGTPATLDPAAIGNTGGSGTHENRPAQVAFNYFIAL